MNQQVNEIREKGGKKKRESKKEGIKGGREKGIRRKEQRDAYGGRGGEKREEEEINQKLS